MHYVILRDDDTNALTPIECLEQLYRPFLDRGLPVNLAVIPEVRTDTLSPEGALEKYLFARSPETAPRLSLTSNNRLVRYLHENPGYHVVQHGCDHSLFEFASEQRADLAGRLQQGADTLAAAGFETRTFVAPYDRFSRVGLAEVARHFDVISAGWFELRRLPFSWWPRYGLKKSLKRSHWKVGRTVLLTHPGCLLSYHRPAASMLEAVKRQVESRRLTVLVTHWWEYFRDGKTDTGLMETLHQTAEWLAGNPEVKVITFDALREPEANYSRPGVARAAHPLAADGGSLGSFPSRIGALCSLWPGARRIKTD
jgi:hypothetical protein